MNDVNKRWRIDNKDDLYVFARLCTTRNVKLFVLAFFRVWSPRSPHHEFRGLRLNVVLADVLDIGGVPAEFDHTDYFTTKFRRVKRLISG